MACRQNFVFTTFSLSDDTITVLRFEITEHNYLILVNNQLDAQFFMYVYLYSVHVSGSHVPIIRRIIESMRHLVYVTV